MIHVVSDYREYSFRVIAVNKKQVSIVFNGFSRALFAILKITLYPDPQRILVKTYYLVDIYDSYNYSTPFVISDEDYQAYKVFIGRWVAFKLIGVPGPELMAPPDRLITNILASKTTDPYHRQYYRVFISLPGSHDVDATNITPSKTGVGNGYSLNITVTVANRGAYTETFNVAAYYGNGTSLPGVAACANATAIGTEEVTALVSGNSTQLVFEWIAQASRTVTTLFARMLGLFKTSLIRPTTTALTAGS